MDNKVAVVIAVAAVVAIVGIGGIAAAMSGMFNGKDDSANYVTYYGNGGATSEGDEKLQSTVLEVMANPFIKEGDTFWGWNTAADGSGTKVDIGDTVTLGTKLYAQWSDLKLSIHNIIYMMQGLSMYISDDVRTDEKITTYEVPLSENGSATLKYASWNTVSITKQDTSSVTFSGTITMYGYQVNITLELDFLGTDSCAFSVSDDGHTAIVNITYHSNVEID